MRTLVNWFRQFDPSFLVTLVVLAILGTSLWILVNIARDLTGQSSGGRWVAVANGDFMALSAPPPSALPSVSPTAAATPALVATAAGPATGTATPVRTATATSTPTMLPPTATPKLVYGVIRQFTNGSVIVREQPNRNSRPLGEIASGQRVEIIETVQGEAIEAQSTDWYHVRYQNLTGYVYARLIDKLP